MDDSTYNDVRRKLTDNLKKIITEFGKLMKHGANGNSNGQETIEEGEAEEWVNRWKIIFIVNG